MSLRRVEDVKVIFVGNVYTSVGFSMVYGRRDKIHTQKRRTYCKHRNDSPAKIDFIIRKV